VDALADLLHATGAVGFAHQAREKAERIVSHIECGEQPSLIVEAPDGAVAGYAALALRAQIAELVEAITLPGRPRGKLLGWMRALARDEAARRGMEFRDLPTGWAVVAGGFARHWPKWALVVTGAIACAIGGLLAAGRIPAPWSVEAVLLVVGPVCLIVGLRLIFEAFLRPYGRTHVPSWVGFIIVFGILGVCLVCLLLYVIFAR
jgi:hypothetical protein